jgi:EAL domain-containing protein (putative c-di-GMP-specific phosphodiesterase class I)/GGDEF domain-containing protein
MTTVLASPTLSITPLAALTTRLDRLLIDARAMLVYVDVRGLRAINRIADPTEGDRVIARVAELMTRWSGRNGHAERLWSNEFIAMKPIDHTQMAVDEAMDLRDRLVALNYRSSLGDNPVSVSIGVLVVSPGVDWMEAIRDAGDASESSKRRGLNQIVVHNPEGPRRVKAMASAAAVTEFRRLLANGRLALHPQPIMDIREPLPQLRKAEFLLRMERKGVHMPVPAGTIETLEYFGLVNELDRFSSQFILDWLADNRGVLDRLHSVSINLSARSIVDGRFMDDLLRDVRNAGLPPGKLCFEITETAAVENLEVAADVIRAFRAAGCGFSLDDFGSGLCSFGYLQQLQVDEVKIDGCFIKEVAQGGASREIVRAIHQVAHATGKRTVAEFVDDPRKLEALREIGIDYAQGWLFYPTVTPEKFLELVALRD